MHLAVPQEDFLVKKLWTNNLKDPRIVTLGNNQKQESPAWPQEAYRLLCSKYSAGLSPGGGGGYPSPVLAGGVPLSWTGVPKSCPEWYRSPVLAEGGVPQFCPGRRGGGNPIMGYPLAGTGVSLKLRLGYPTARTGVPQSCPGWGSTPVLAEGYPSPVLAEGGTPVLSWPGGGTQSWSIPLAGTGVSPKLGLGYPTARTGVQPQPGLGYPLERTWDQRPEKEPGTGVPPGCEWTDPCENITFPIHRMRAVNMYFYSFLNYFTAVVNWVLLEKPTFCVSVCQAVAEIYLRLQNSLPWKLHEWSTEVCNKKRVRLSPESIFQNYHKISAMPKMIFNCMKFLFTSDRARKRSWPNPVWDCLQIFVDTMYQCRLTLKIWSVWNYEIVQKLISRR